MKRFQLFVFLPIAILVLILSSYNSSIADFARGIIIWFDCPAEEGDPARSGWRVLEDLNDDGEFDWETTLDCDGNICSEPYQGNKVIIGNVGPSVNRPNEARVYTEITSPTGNKGWKIRSFNNVTNQTYYIVTSFDQNPVLELLTPPPTININSEQNSNSTLRNDNKSIEKVKIYQNQSYEYSEIECKEAKSGKGWSIRTFNSETNETYYTVVSCNGKPEVIYPNKNTVSKVNEILIEDISQLKVYPMPSDKSQLNIDFISSHSGEIEIRLLDFNGKETGNVLKNVVYEGKNSIVFPLNNYANGNYILSINDGKNIYSTSILIVK
ncbi:hypothetical protein MASR1M45_02000 [Candidatus Kapaibacterium sp.]